MGHRKRGLERKIREHIGELRVYLGGHFYERLRTMVSHRTVFCINCLLPVYELFVDAKGEACPLEKRLYNIASAQYR